MLKRASVVLMFTGWMALAAPSPARADDAAPGPNKALPSLHDGLRLTYSYKIATIPGPVNGVRDPKDSLTAQNGESRTQVSITRIDGDVIVFTQAEFSILPGGLLAPGVAAGFTETVSQTLLGNYWLTPQVMDLYLKTPAAGITAFRTPFKIDETVYDAVSIKTEGPNFTYVYVYDTKTGLLLHSGKDSLLPGLKAHPGGMVFRTDRQIILVDLLSTRQTHVPWADQAMPDWVAKTHVMHFSDKAQLLPVQYGNLPPFVSPPTLYQSDISFTEHGNGWVKVSVKTSVGKQAFPNAFGTTSFGGLWIAPAGLAALHEGQVLDEDPITRVVTVVSKVDDTSVTIASSNPTVQSEAQYEKRSGILMSAHSIGGAQRAEFTRRLLGID